MDASNYCVNLRGLRKVRKKPISGLLKNKRVVVQCILLHQRGVTIDLTAVDGRYNILTRRRGQAHNANCKDDANDGENRNCDPPLALAKEVVEKPWRFSETPWLDTPGSERIKCGLSRSRADDAIVMHVVLGSIFVYELHFCFFVSGLMTIGFVGTA